MTLRQRNGEWFGTGMGKGSPESSNYELLQNQELQKESRYLIAATNIIIHIQLLYQGLSRFLCGSSLFYLLFM